MHALQPKHEKMSDTDAEKILVKLNIALAQLPKISKKDLALPVDCDKGDVIKISRADEEYFRVVI